jgi:large subunit ribosomal protein L13e
MLWDPWSEAKPSDTIAKPEWDEVSIADNSGFTLAEIKAAGLGVAFAQSIGIAVDHRRKNRSQESLDLNRSRLQAYVGKLVLYPRHANKLVTKANGGVLNDTANDAQKVTDKPQANNLPALIRRVKTLSTGEVAKLKKDKVFRILRQEWSNQRNNGRRLAKAANAEAKKKWLPLI